MELQEQTLKLVYAPSLSAFSFWALFGCLFGVTEGYP